MKCKYCKEKIWIIEFLNTHKRNVCIVCRQIERQIEFEVEDNKHTKIAKKIRKEYNLK